MEEQWKKTSQKYFGGFLGAKRDRFHFDILCVLLGIKSAHLVDYFPPAAAAQPHKLQLFLQEILHLSRSCDCTWTHQNLCILLLDEDILFVNFTSLVAYRNALPSPVFVNVTCGKGTPVIIEKQEEQMNCIGRLISSAFDVMERHFSAHSASDDSIPIIRHCCHRDRSADGSGEVADNLCSLFGQLLGYPVVYWFNTSKGYHLDMERLVRHSVMARRDRVNGARHREQVCAYDS